PCTPDTTPLALHDALPICRAHGTQDGVHLVCEQLRDQVGPEEAVGAGEEHRRTGCGRNAARIEVRGKLGIGANPCELLCTGLLRDRKSTRLNSSHVKISYA